MTRLRTACLALLACAGATPLAAQGATLLRTLSGPTGAEFGHAVASGGDVDLDGVPQRCEVHALGSAFNRMATQLAHLDGARKRMIADLTHDLLSPLTNLRGYVEGLRDGVVTAAPQVFTMLEGEIGRLIRLVSDLHQLNLAEATRGRLVLAKIAAPQLLADSTSFIAHAAAVKGITIDVTSDGVETVEAAGIAALRAKSLQLTAAFIALVEARCAGFGLDLAFRAYLLTVGKKGREQLRREYAKYFVAHVDLSQVRRVGYANAHAVAEDIIARFGRFPHRNSALGRETTEEEQAFLDSGGFAG